MAAKKSRRRTQESPSATELLVLELQQIHSAESQLSRALPRLNKVVESQTLRDMLELRLQQGEQVISDVESALDELDESPGRRKNAAAEGLINDAREQIQEIEAGPALDAVLIAGIQKTEHYCIAAWGTVRSLAQATNQKDAVQAMERALQEGKKFDEQLTQLAEEEITPELLQAGADESAEADDEEEGEEESIGSSGGRSGRSGRGGNNRRTSA
jgi:ferritin-like metal-binding protein YciE